MNEIVRFVLLFLLWGGDHSLIIHWTLDIGRDFATILALQYKAQISSGLVHKFARHVQT